jgi:hypothetical protein
VDDRGDRSRVASLQVDRDERNANSHACEDRDRLRHCVSQALDQNIVGPVPVDELRSQRLGRLLDFVVAHRLGAIQQDRILITKGKADSVEQAKDRLLFASVLSIVTHLVWE